jgi:hypothetical protein
MAFVVAGSAAVPDVVDGAGPELVHPARPTTAAAATASPARTAPRGRVTTRFYRIKPARVMPQTNFA